MSGDLLIVVVFFGLAAALLPLLPFAARGGAGRAGLLGVVLAMLATGPRPSTARPTIPGSISAGASCTP